MVSCVRPGRGEAQCRDSGSHGVLFCRYGYAPPWLGVTRWSGRMSIAPGSESPFASAAMTSYAVL